MIKIHNMTKSFTHRYQPVLQNINLEIPPGEFCVLLGSNGSGKSTLLKLISGEYLADQGSIYIDGNKVTPKHRLSCIASVVQDVNKGTIPEMTLLENLVLSRLPSQRGTLRFYTRAKKAIMKQIDMLNSDLLPYLNSPLRHLSGGQRQLVATLMAFQTQPQLLLLDEHTAALDPKMQRHLMQYTADSIAQQHLTCMMITHHLADALTYGNRLIMLHQSKIILDVSGKDKQSLTLQQLSRLFQADHLAEEV